MSDHVLAWHFLSDSGRGRDGNSVQVGSTMHVSGPVQCCSHGLHASERLIDALGYAPGPVLTRVELWGEVDRESDKLCATNRKVLVMADITPILHEFACRVAEQALKVAKVTDPRCQTAIDTKGRWLRNEASDAELDAAWAAAWDAARAAGAAARAAARAAAAAAAWDAAAAAGDAAWAAAWDAARAAAWDAAWAAGDAAETEQDRILTEMVMEMAEFAAITKGGESVA